MSSTGQPRLFYDREHAVASAGFDRLLILRAARKPDAATHAGLGRRLAHWVLGIFKSMVPSAEQPERVWEAAREPADAVARRWLG